MCIHFLCFFFSSRRRHTIFDCDWSSDVCSSDLIPEESLDLGQDRRPLNGGLELGQYLLHRFAGLLVEAPCRRPCPAALASFASFATITRTGARAGTGARAFAARRGFAVAVAVALTWAGSTAAQIGRASC